MFAFGSAVVLAALFLFLAPAPAAFALNFEVDDPADDSDTSIDGICLTVNTTCTLRAALEEAQGNSGPHTVTFEIPINLTRTITPATPLPELDSEITIDGRSQGVFDGTPSYTGPPIIVVDGGTTVTTGLSVVDGTATIIGLAIRGFDVGIDITDGSDHLIRGNYIGIDADGETARPNGTGIAVDGFSAPDLFVTIGGATAADRNVISGNAFDGILMGGDCGCGEDVSRIQGNYIGLNAAGTASVPNGTAAVEAGNGIRIFDGFGVIIGGAGAGEGNVISGNTKHGVMLEGFFTEDIHVVGNRIGTSWNGTAAVGNGLDGVSVVPELEDEEEGGPFDSVIGGSDPGSGNLISGNGRFGIRLLNTDDIDIRGNVIGLAANGVTPLPNVIGIAADNAVDTDIGGSSAARRNVISGNTEQGVRLFGDCGCFGDPTQVRGNYIGLRVDGAQAAGNGSDGVQVVAGAGIIVGGDSPGEGNIISGNARDGVSLVGDDTVFLAIFGNRVGTNAAGTAPIANGRDGVSLTPYELSTIGPPGAFIGADDPGTGNLISGNGRHGIYMRGVPFETLVAHNLIGVDLNGAGSIPNARSGVFLEQSIEVFVYENVIANNGRAGVLITPSVSILDEVGNVVSTNQMFGNQGLGIDITDNNDPDAPGNTVTANDLTETDGVQNFPDITTATTSSQGTVVGGTLTSTPDTSFRVELFASPSCDPSGNGEGRTFMGSLEAGTGSALAPNGTGIAAFAMTVGALPLNHFITATATNPDLITSEFSACEPVTTAQILVSPASGLTTTEAGGQATFTIALTTVPVDDVTITLTNTKPGEASISPTSVTFLSGVAPAAQTVTLTGLADTVADGNQPYTIQTSPADTDDPVYKNVDPPDVLAINQDSGSVPSLSIEPAQATEGTGASVPMSFTVRLAPTSTQTVSATWQVINGTAQIAADIENTDAAGTVTFAAGESVKQIVVRIIGDTVPEPTETFTIRLQNSSNAAISTDTATGTILDNDVAGGPCSPRPNVVMTTTRTGTSQLVVSVTAGVGSIKKISFGSQAQPMQNAQVESIGPVALIQNFGVFTPPPNVKQQSFILRRLNNSQPAMVTLVIEDDCGEWKTFVGTGQTPW